MFISIEIGGFLIGVGILYFILYSDTAIKLEKISNSFPVDNLANNRAY